MLIVVVWLFSESVEETSSNVKMKTRIKSFQSTILTRKEKNAFQDTTDVMAGQIYLSTRIRKDFFQIFFRHDCQDGSDENDCNFSNIKVNKKFM